MYMYVTPCKQPTGIVSVASMHTMCVCVGGGGAEGGGC